MGKVQPSISRFFQVLKLEKSPNSECNVSIDLTQEEEDFSSSSPMKRKLVRNQLKESKVTEANSRKKAKSDSNIDPVTLTSTGSIASQTGSPQGESKDEIEIETIEVEDRDREDKDNMEIEVKPKNRKSPAKKLKPIVRTIPELDEEYEEEPVKIKSPSPVPVKTKGKAETKPKTNPPKRTTKQTTASVSKLTPLEKQIVQFKLDHPDKILAIQVGYKFKFFGPDAVIVAKILNIMLVPGKIKLDEENSQYDRIAYCSIPDNRLHVHLQRLLSQGLKVGVVKQTETAAVKQVDGNKNSLFERKVTAVYTRATYMDDEMLNMSSNEGASNGKYILCIDELACNGSGQVSMVAVLPATGEILYDVFVDNVTRSELETRLTYLSPSEILVISLSEVLSKELKKVVMISSSANNAKVEHIVRKQTLKYDKTLQEFFEESSDLLEYYINNFTPNIRSCIVELIMYLTEFKLSNVFTIKTNIQHFSDTKQHMLLPANTLQSLEIFHNSNNNTSGKGSLIWILNHTRTKMGERLLTKWISKPLIDKIAIEQRLDAVLDLKSSFNHFIESLLKQLDKVGKAGLDFENSMIKVHYAATYKMDKIGRKETFIFLRILTETLDLVRNFETQISEMTLSSCLLRRIFTDLLEFSKSDSIPKLFRMINPLGALDESDPYNQKVSFFKHKWEEVEKVTHEINEIESLMQQELAGVRKLLKRPQLNYVTNMKETHLIEVRNGAMTNNLPLDWIKINSTKSVSRFRTPEISKLLKNLNYQNDMLLQACDSAYSQFLTQIDSQYDYITKIVRSLLEFDCLLSLSAASSTSVNLVKPEFVNELTIDIKQGRNPIIESLKQDYIPNDISMSYDSNRSLIITGPNMGGKSSYVRQVALIVILAQIGCYVPCESAKLGVFDSIFTRMGAQDNIIRGESTFMVEMMECSYILQNVTDRSLVILDEIGRGTGTTDGISIAYSILDYFINSKCLTLFITHYPSLHIFENLYPGIVENYHMGFIEQQRSEGEWPEIVFLYNVAKGVVTNLYGLNVAKLAGILEEIVQKAYKKSIEMKEEIERIDAERFGIELVKVMKKVESERSDEELYQKLKLLSANL